MSFNVKSEILAAIAKTETAETKTLLLLMLGVLEEIGGKIDDFLKDEKLIREKVLNGHEPYHHKHHDWVAEQIEKERQRELVCEWAKKKMADEMVADQHVKNRWQKMLDKAAEQAVVILITLIAAGLGLMAYLK